MRSVDQVAAGDIVNVCTGCSGGVPESKLQADFFRDTGIWCPRGAREQLERLMDEHGFTAPRLRAAWQANNLVWDADRQELVAKTHWLESTFGYGLAALVSVYFVLHVGQILLLGHEGWRALTAILTAAAMWGGLLWLTLRFVIVPHGVAMKARRALPSERGGSKRMILVDTDFLLPNNLFRVRPQAKK